MSTLRFTVIGLFLTLAACRTIEVAPDQFNRVSRDYNNMIRWQEFQTAVQTYVSPDLAGPFSEKLATLRDSKIVDYKIVETSLNSKKGEADVTVELYYYTLPSARLKMVVDRQKWVYVEEGQQRGWKRISLPPEFQ